MRRPESDERIFKKSDGEMLSQADVFYDSITEDKAAFVNFDSMFDDPYIPDFKTKIDAGYALKSDDYYKEVIAQNTEILDLAIVKGKDEFFYAEHFVDKLEKNTPGIKDKFGYRRYDRARKSQTGMVLLMDDFHDVAVEYAAELILEGYSQVKIDNLEVVYQNIRKANKNQEKAKKDRKIATNTRIETLNTVWEVMAEISKVAKIIYADDYGHYQRYLLYEHEAAGGPVTYSGTVPADGTATVKEDVVPTDNFLLKNPGTTVLKYCLGDDLIPCADGIEVQPNAQHQTTAAELGTGTILKVSNKSVDTEGSYEVVVS
jgi:hypothetical protein